MRFLQTITISASVALTSCAGYQLGGAKPAKYARIQTIAIPQVENLTFEPRLSALATNSIVDQFNHDGTYRITTINKADAVLEASVEEIDYSKYSANRFDTAASDELRSEVIIRWQLTQNGQVIGSGRSKGHTNFFVNDNLETARQNALPLATSRAAKQIVYSLAEGF